jgi:solute carrier family 12 (potassium/chloride transporters), member 9
VPEAKLTDTGDGQRTITFAEQPVHQLHSPAHSRQQSRQHSRRPSAQTSVFEQEGTNSIRMSAPGSPDKTDPVAGDDDVDETGSAYSTQGIALSFNELPSRAQHLILNELMRRHSNNTAVLLSTLPVPSEGTSLDETATIRYLSDIEIFCNELPPTMLVLSNNMTVTVSL